MRLSKFNRSLVWVAAGVFAAVGSAKAVDFENLTINGYASFEYEQMIDEEGRGDENGSFDADGMDLVFNAKPIEKFRAALDVGFEHGAATEDDRGNIAMEYGFVEYAVADLLRVRAGKILTPFGIVNEIHTAKPAFLSVKEPFSLNKPEKMVKDAYRFFPRWGAGIALQGDGAVANQPWDYDLLILNGEQEVTNPYDEDNNSTKGIAARIRMDVIDGLTLGNSFYMDDDQTMIETSEDEVTGEETESEVDYSLISDGISAVGRVGQFKLQAEAVLGELSKSGEGVTQFGWYVQPSYRFDMGLTPYLRYEFLNPDTDSSASDDTVFTLIAGLNYEVNRYLYLKIENDWYQGEDESKIGQLPGNGYNEIKASISAAF